MCKKRFIAFPNCLIITHSSSCFLPTSTPSYYIKPYCYANNIRGYGTSQVTDFLIEKTLIADLVTNYIMFGKI